MYKLETQHICSNLIKIIKCLIQNLKKMNELELSKSAIIFYPQQKNDTIANWAYQTTYMVPKDGSRE